MPITSNIDSCVRLYEYKSQTGHSLPRRPKLTRYLNRPFNHDTPYKLSGEAEFESARERAENYQRIAERRYRDVGQPYLCSAYDDPHKIHEEAGEVRDPCLYRDYRRTGPRLPYHVWPKKVTDFVQPNIEPEHYDQFVRQEGEYYRKIYNLTRNLRKVSSHLETCSPKKPVKVRFGDEEKAEVYEPKNELQRVKCLWKALEKAAFQKEKVHEGFPPIAKFALPKNPEAKKKFGIPWPGSNFVDPSPAAPHVQDKPIISLEQNLRYHPQDDERKESGPLLRLYDILTEEEKREIRETCTHLFSSSFPRRLTDDRDFNFCPHDFIINICNTAKHEAVIAGHCSDFSNYWDSTHLKHYFDPRNLKKWIVEGKSPEYYNANYENDNQVKRKLNTDPTNEFNKFEPFCEVHYRSNKEGKKAEKKATQPQAERRVKYKWAKPEENGESEEKFKKEYKPMKSSTEHKDKFFWPPNWCNGYFLRMIMAIYRMVDFWNLVFEMEDPEEVWRREECINLKVLGKRYEDATKIGGKYTRACGLQVPRVIPRTVRIPRICRASVVGGNHTVASWLLGNSDRAKDKSRVQINYLSQTKRDFLDESRISLLTEKQHKKKGLCMNDMLDNKIYSYL